MTPGATEDEIGAVVGTIERFGMTPVRLPGGDHMAIGVSSAIPPEIRDGLFDALSHLAGVDHAVHISRPYKLASREFHPEDSVFSIRDVEFGANECVVMAGPCSVENRDQIFAAARAVRDAGARVLRGGAYKPRTSPYSFQGLGPAGLELLRDAGREFKLLTVTEVVSPEDVELVAAHADILQIGARNMQNYALLVAAGRAGHPVLLKRGASASLNEFLLAAEYLLYYGTSRVLLCERGVHPIDATYTRNTLDLNAVPVLKHVSHLPVIVDPSHGTGDSRYVAPLARAGVAVGADGLIVEVHPDPALALSDGQQSLTPLQFAALMDEVRGVAAAIGRRVASY